MMYLKMYEYCEEDILEVGKLFEFCNRSSTNRLNIQTKEGSGNEEVQANTEELLGITRRWLIGGGVWIVTYTVKFTRLNGRRTTTVTRFLYVQMDATPQWGSRVGRVGERVIEINNELTKAKDQMLCFSWCVTSRLGSGSR